jgi:hypothetical protein
MADSGLKSPLAQQWGVAKDIPVGRVYLGGGYASYSGGTPTGGYAPMADMTADVDAAAQGFNSLSPEAMRSVKAAADAAFGYSVPQTNLESFYEKMVKGAYQLQQSRGLKVTPLEYPEYMKQVFGPGAFGSQGGGAGGPSTTVSESINLSNPSEARAFLDDALGRVLGRIPTALEYQNFTKALNAAETESPTVTSSTTSGKGSGSTRTKSKTKGGVAPSQIAAEYARSQDMAAETLGGTLGFDAFIEAIG